MKAIKIVGTLVLFCFLAMSHVFAQTEKAKSTAGKEAKMEPAMNNTYLVMVPHTKEQCMNVIDGIKEKGSAYLSKFKFGCMSGDHTAYAFLTGSSEEAVRKTLPADVQSMAKIEKVNSFTPEQLEKMHKEM